MIDRFYTKIAGVSHPNDDGSSRQDIIKKCVEGEALFLEYYPIPDHPEAVRVKDAKGRQLGWLKTSVAHEYSELIEEGKKVIARVVNITGGTSNKETFGCNIEIIVYTDDNDIKFVRDKKTVKSLPIGKYIVIAVLVVIAIIILVTCFRMFS